MAVEVLQKRIENGVELMVFVPTSQMRLYAMTAFCDRGARGRSPEAICDAAGLPHSAYDRFLKYEPWFTEWLEDRRIELGGKSLKTALEAVGTEQALKGEFQFWKPLAIREGVISPDKLEIGASIPSDLGAYKEMSPNDLRALESSVLASLRGEGEAHPGEITLAEGPQGWERQGDPGGAPEVPEPVVLAGQLGSHGERALSELESF